ncbi:hypothetical protein EDD37DRAFT_627652 [Exophiala viscosa]|uniref:uncharacterized protein n=1 Tax=Exophiala viscosa TaxID=2486360 RepID=UPI00218F124B|nr:hypothetical protein EDD37DRAFT_627652 [Exophiala viscosa]
METVCVPMHLDAFSLCPGNCEKENVIKIAPYTQPNYTALRLDNRLIQHDVLDHIDFHNVSPATKNSRMADTSKPPPTDPSSTSDTLKRARMGVHLSWSLPRLYRTAKPTGDQQDSAGNITTNTAPPAFRTMPDRWLITRYLNNANDFPGAPEYKSWVVESNVTRKLNDGTIPDDTDLESEVSPFVLYDTHPGDSDVLNSQTEVFLGQRFDLSTWSESAARNHMQNLTPMTSANPFFADYALHNTNVLSIIDNFAYENDPKTGEVHYLPNANCDYFVIGWHSAAGDDPLQEAVLVNGSERGLSDRLASLKLQLSDGSKTKFGGSKALTRCLVYGAIYGVIFDIKNNQKSLADNSAANFTSAKKTDPLSVTNAKRIEPLSMGTTPLDAILTFLEAHETDAGTFFKDPKAGELATDLLAIASFLYASTDDYDSRVKAQDLMSQQNFSRSDGGVRWTFSQQPVPGGIPDAPPAEKNDLVEALNSLNETQAQYDAKSRRLQLMQWDLFAEWWKYVSEYMTDTDKKNRAPFYTSVIKDLKYQIQKLQSQLQVLQGPLGAAKTSTHFKSAPYSAFSTRLDPTLCVAGLDSGWPSDASDTLTAHMKSELPPRSSQSHAIVAQTKENIWTDNDMQESVARLLLAFMQNSTTKNGDPATVDSMTGDIASVTTTGFRQWGGGNPFVPIFIEWEAIYYHVGDSDNFRDHWTVHLAPSPVGHDHSQVRYTPKLKLADEQDPKSHRNPNHTDFRTVSGRVPILPQPVFSLEALVLQVLNNNPKGLQEALSYDSTTSPADQIQALRQRIRQIKFLSAPLDGLTSHLLTRCEGAHVRPLVRNVDNTLAVLNAALRTDLDDGSGSSTAHAVELCATTLALIDAQSAQTPYGTLLPFGSDVYPDNPFKPVTHGQFAFTKLNIVDKFGQAICLPDQNRRLRNWDPSMELASKVYPCMSDYLSPDLCGPSTLNTVFPLATDEGVSLTPHQYPLCPYMQLTPAINQPARINAAFLKQEIGGRDKNGQAQFSAWREALDFEQPVWGWMVINYADEGIQFFLADGTFYGELRKGGVNLVSDSKKWLPFAPQLPSDTTAPQIHQLNGLMNRLNDPAFLQSFFDMINGSIAHMPFPPSDYSAFANAVVGKPLALVNVGWSLELSTPALTSQNTYPLPKTPVSWTERTKAAQAELSSYTFPLKIGDWERTYDGVVGYFSSSNDGHPNPSTAWDMLYTYFAADDNPPDPKHVQIISGEEQFLPLQPKYIDPLDVAANPSLTAAKAAQYTVTTMIMDPYTPIHGYSPILPTVSLTLPAWAVQQAFQKMHAFFHMGPILSTIDVPPTKDMAASAQIKLPIAGKKGTWSWLQPYSTLPAPMPAPAPAPTPGTQQNPEFATLSVTQDTGTENFRKGPYTLLEGYLELMGTLAGAGLPQAATAGSAGGTTAGR